MPADITGTMVLTQDGRPPRGCEFQPGPVFADLVLADEINRAPPKTQSALLEAMQEWQVTIAGETRPLPQPFCVLATQNPVESEGTYPLPEAQLDRFLLKLRFEYPTQAELQAIIARSTAKATEDMLERVADARLLLRMNALVRNVPAATRVLDYIARLLLALQPSSPDATPLARQYLRLGPSPRGGQAMSLAGRAAALLDGRHNLSFQDVRKSRRPCCGIVSRSASMPSGARSLRKQSSPRRSNGCPSSPAARDRSSNQYRSMSDPDPELLDRRHRAGA